MSLIGALLLAAGASAQVPFVGCPADGQAGPQPRTAVRRMPPVPAAAASRLAWYVSGYSAVLAPRGWHCFLIYGSDGMALYVAPEPLSLDRLRHDGPGLRGPAIVLQGNNGGTSGRWGVAHYIARYFPHYRSFIQEIRDMGLTVGELPAGPYPRDRIVSRTATRIRLITPAGVEGEGTSHRLAPARDPVETLILLHPDRDMDTTSIQVRLPRGQTALAGVIFAEARRRALAGD